MANQDTQVKCFLSASTCRDNSALCKQTRRPRPRFVEASQVLLLLSATLWQMHAASHRTGLPLSHSYKRWFNTLLERQIFIYHCPWHVYKALRDSFQSLPSKLHMRYLIIALLTLLRQYRRLCSACCFGIALMSGKHPGHLCGLHVWRSSLLWIGGSSFFAAEDKHKPVSDIHTGWKPLCLFVTWFWNNPVF